MDFSPVAWTFYPVMESGGYSLVVMQGFSCSGAWVLGAWASVVAAHGLSSCGSWALQHRLNSGGAGAWLLCGMWDPPGSGMKPVSSALKGGFFTTEPSGKCFNFPS